MKKYIATIAIAFAIVGTSMASVENVPGNKGGGKHHSHKKAKKRKSGYMFNFQH